MLSEFSIRQIPDVEIDDAPKGGTIQLFSHFSLAVIGRDQEQTSDGMLWRAESEIQHAHDARVN